MSQAQATIHAYFRFDRIVSYERGSFGPFAVGPWASSLVRGRPDSILDDVFGRALTFTPYDGIYLSLGDRDDRWQSGFTLGGWIRPAGGVPAPVFSLELDDSSHISLLAGDRLQLISPTEDGWMRRDIPGPIVPGRWTHVSLVYDLQRIAVYVNGKKMLYEPVAIALTPKAGAGIGSVPFRTPRTSWPESIRGLAFSADGRFAAIVRPRKPGDKEPSHVVALYDVAQGVPLCNAGTEIELPIRSRSETVWAAFGGAHGERVVVIDESGLTAFNTATGAELTEAGGGSDEVIDNVDEVIASSDGSTLVLRYGRKLVRYDAMTARPAGGDIGANVHNAQQGDDVISVAVSADGTRVLARTAHEVTVSTSSFTKTTGGSKSWTNAPTPQVFGGAPLTVDAAALSPDGRTVAIAGDYGAWLYDVDTKKELLDPGGQSLGIALGIVGEGPVRSMEFVDNTDVLILGVGWLARLHFTPGQALDDLGAPVWWVEIDGNLSIATVYAAAGIVQLSSDQGWCEFYDLDNGSARTQDGLGVTTLRIDEYFYGFALPDGVEHDDPNGYEPLHKVLLKVAVTPDGSAMFTSYLDDDGRTRVFDLPLLFGAGFTGAVADLSARNRPQLPEDIGADVKASLPEVRVGTIFPLEFTLHDGNQHQALYLRELPQQLRIDIRNVSDHALRIPPGSADRGTGTFEVWLRPGTLAPAPGGPGEPGFDRTTVMLVDTPGWTVTWQPGPHAADGSDVFVLHREVSEGAPSASDVGSALGVGESLAVTFDGLQLDTSREAHTTRVQLKFRVEHHDGSPIAGSRLHHLRILPESDSKLHKRVVALGDQLKASEVRATTLTGRVDTLEQQEKLIRQMTEAGEQLATHEFFSHGGPLAATTVGVGALRNDGVTENVLRVRIDDHVRGEATVLSRAADRPPTFTLHLTAPSPPPGIEHDASRPDTWLLTAHDLAGSTVEVQPATLWKAQRTDGGWSIGPAPTDPTRWPAHLSPIDVTLTTQCRTATGTGQLRITYDNVGDDAAMADPPNGQRTPSPQGLLVVPVERSSFVSVSRTRTIANGTIELTETPRIGLRHGTDGHPATVALDLDETGGLRVQSTGHITLRPSCPAVDLAPPTPPAAGPGAPVVATTDVAVVGSLGVQGDVHAEGHDVVALGATFAGSLSLSPTSQVHLGGVDGGSWLVPAGAIMMWWGSDDPPVGWAICDGTQGTPDMRSRFPVGAFSPGPPLGCAGPPESLQLSPHVMGATGGEEKHKLLINELPSHDHSFCHNKKKHDHGMTKAIGLATTDEDDDSLSVWAPRNEEMKAEAAYIEDTFTHVSDGKDDTHENLPPYRALHFIMKLPPTSAKASAKK